MDSTYSTSAAILDRASSSLSGTVSPSMSSSASSVESSARLTSWFSIICPLKPLNASVPGLTAQA